MNSEQLDMDINTGVHVFVSLSTNKTIIHAPEGSTAQKIAEKKRGTLSSHGIVRLCRSKSEI